MAETHHLSIHRLRCRRPATVGSTSRSYVGVTWAARAAPARPADSE